MEPHPFSAFEDAFRLWGNWSGPHGQDRAYWPHQPHYQGRVGTRRFLFFDTSAGDYMGELTATDDDRCANWLTLERGELCRRVMVELIGPRDMVSGPTRIYGQLIVHSWPAATLVVTRVDTNTIFTTAIPFNKDPVSCRLWGDYLLDVETRPYLLDYLTDRSETFAQWMKELPQ